MALSWEEFITSLILDESRSSIDVSSEETGSICLLCREVRYNSIPTIIITPETIAFSGSCFCLLLKTEEAESSFSFSILYTRVSRRMVQMQGVFSELEKSRLVKKLRKPGRP